MFGAHADHFMLAQMRERVTAITPNAGSSGLRVPDRERAGAPHVQMRAGFGMPGPQRVVSSKFIPGRGALPGMSSVDEPSGGALPGMGTYVESPAYQGSNGLAGVGRSGALPGMGYFRSFLDGIGLSGVGRSGALPGMGGGALPGMSGAGRSGSLPGMGEATISTTTVLGLAAIGALLFFAMNKKGHVNRPAEPNLIPGEGGNA